MNDSYDVLDFTDVNEDGVETLRFFNGPQDGASIQLAKRLWAGYPDLYFHAASKRPQRYVFEDDGTFDENGELIDFKYGYYYHP